MRHATTRGLLAMLALMAPTVGTAQDVEVRAAQMKRTLPRAYYEAKAQDSTAFELSAGWRTRPTTRTAPVTGSPPR